MPLMVSDKPLHIAKGGIDARFEPGVPRNVRPSMVTLAESRGARRTESESTPAKASTEAADTPTDEQVRDAIEQLMAEASTEAFGSDERPKVSALKEQLGKPVKAAQRDLVWETMLNEG